MDRFPLQYTAPAVIPSTDSTRPVRSVTLTGHGSISKIKVTETPLPKDVGDDHVEVNVHYCGLSFTDNYLRLGIIRNKKFPVIMGSECSGIVTRVGKDVTDLQVGQKVLCLKIQGGLFRHIVHVQRKYCFLLPDDISVKEAVGLGLNFVVAHICLHEIGRLAESQTVFMQSIAGGVGTALIQLACTVDKVEVYGTAYKLKHDQLKSLGLRRAFTGNMSDEHEIEIRREHPKGVDIVVNTHGTTDIERCTSILKHGGRLVLLGSNSTTCIDSPRLLGIFRPIWDGGALSSVNIIDRSRSVTGVNVGLWLDFHTEVVQRCLSEIFKLYSSGKIKPYIHAVLPFDQVAEGIWKLSRRLNIGKFILEVKQEAAETSAAEIPASADPQPETVEPKEKAVQVVLEDPTQTAEPKVAEPSHNEKLEEKVAGAKSELGAS